MRPKSVRGGRAEARPFSPPGGEIPHSEVDEKAALGCVILAGSEGSQAEVDELLGQLRPSLFWNVVHQEVLAGMKSLRAERHAVDLVTLDRQVRGTDAGKLKGNLVAELMHAAPTWHNFPSYLATLQEMALRRWTLAKKDRLSALASDPTLSLDTLREEFAEISDTAQKIGRPKSKLIEVVTVEEAQAYEPNPDLYLFGDDMISKGDMCVICGWPGLGKSRLATTLALAGATGRSWMGYRARRAGIKTLILQSENSLRRIKSEVQGVDPQLSEFVRFTKPTTLAFHLPEFRKELLAYWEKWPFDILVVDPWTDVVKAAEAGDVQDAFDNVRMSLPIGEQKPALVIVAHCRKQGRVDKFKPRAGAELMHEVIGSQATVSKARTVFAIQPESPDATSDVVVFDCGKSNNDRPNPPSAWIRANGEFRLIPDFDFDAWKRSGDDQARTVVTEEDMAKALKVPKKRAEAAKALVELGFSTATAYRYLSGDSKFADRMTFDKDGRIGWTS